MRVRNKGESAGLRIIVRDREMGEGEGGDED